MFFGRFFNSEKKFSLYPFVLAKPRYAPGCELEMFEMKMSTGTNEPIIWDLLTWDQCDHVWRNFDTLKQFLKSCINFCGFILYLEKY